MKPLLVYGLLVLLTPAIAGAQSLIDSVKSGAGKAAGAIGGAAGTAVDATKKATGAVTGAVTDTVTSTTESLSNEATPEQTRDKLDEMAQQTLDRLFAEHPESQNLFDQSAGYAVFDAREASFYVAAGYGRGVAVSRETGLPVYMKMATLGAGLGFGLGGFSQQIIILFQSSEQLQKFMNSGFDATAEAGVMSGDEKQNAALRFNEGKAVFVLTKKGWRVSAELTGSRYWPDEDLNNL